MPNSKGRGLLAIFDKNGSEPVDAEPDPEAEELLKILYSFMADTIGQRMERKQFDRCSETYNDQFGAMCMLEAQSNYIRNCAMFRLYGLESEISIIKRDKKWAVTCPHYQRCEKIRKAGPGVMAKLMDK